MAMTYTQSTGSNDGIFLERRTVSDVKDLSGTVHPHIMKAFDLYIQIYFHPRTKDGKTFEVYPLEVFGNLKRDPETSAVDESSFGQAFKVGDALMQMGVQLSLDENYRIPAGLLAQCIGKEVTVLSYIYKAKKDDKGVFRAKYTTWDRIAPAGGEEQLKKLFQKQVKEGFMKNYRPNAVAEANEERELAEAAGVPSNGEAKADDDLPF